MRIRAIPPSWQSYRSRDRLAVGLLVGGLPGAVVLVIAAKVVFRLSNDFVFIAVMLLWCIAWGWAAFRVARWPCPRCGVAWLSNQDARLGTPRRCASCGLALYEQP